MPFLMVIRYATYRTIVTFDVSMFGQVANLGLTAGIGGI
jgi:hypothetical protein